MIRSTLAHLHVAALSHAGMSGKNNEDRYAVSSFQLSKDDSRPALFAIIADGIGGHRAGEVAGPPLVERLYVGEAELAEVEPVDERIDRTDRIVLAHIVVELRWKHSALPAIQPLDKSRHRRPRRFSVRSIAWK